MPDLTVEVIEKLSTMIPPTVLRIGDESFTSNKVYPIEQAVAEGLTVFSLDSVIDYVNSNYDKIPEEQGILINVNNYNCVYVCGRLNNSKRRDLYLKAEIKNGMRLNQYLQIEDFILMMQSCFKEDPAQVSVLKIASEITDEHIRVNKDDGITQTVTVKSGIARKDYAEIPNPVKLVPFRTFPEIEQPEGLFIFRAQKTASGPMLGLFDCDSNEWKARTIRIIKMYLSNAVKDKALII